mgnify:CR=1 FL=1
MSKKIAEGIMGLVMDIKVGNGAFMKTKKDAFKLSHLIQKVAISYGLVRKIWLPFELDDSI